MGHDSEMDAVGSDYGKANFIKIHTDKQIYYGGDKISGKVMLSLMQPMIADGIYILLEGYEKTSFEDHTATEFLMHSKCLLYHHCCIHYVGGETIQPGNYVLPFTVKLTTGKSGSFALPKGLDEDTNADTFYKIQADFRISPQETLTSEQEIIICNPAPPMNLYNVPEREGKVSYLWCIPKGLASLCVKIEQCDYKPGDPIEVFLEVNNASTVDLPSLKVELTRTIKICADNSYKLYKETMSSCYLKGPKAGETSQYTANLKIPRVTPAQTFGALITCQYLVRTTLDVPWSSAIVHKWTVQVFQPEKSDYQKNFTYPLGCETTTFHTINLATMPCEDDDMFGIA